MSRASEDEALNTHIWIKHINTHIYSYWLNITASVSVPVVAISRARAAALPICLTAISTHLKWYLHLIAYSVGIGWAKPYPHWLQKCVYMCESQTLSSFDSTPLCLITTCTYSYTHMNVHSRHSPLVISVQTNGTRGQSKSWWWQLGALLLSPKH